MATAADDSDHDEPAAPAEGGSIDFGAFVMSLATSALMHMGEQIAEHEPPHIDLALAKETIDILGMLHHKTRGNLTPDETRTMESALYDLRLRFLKAKQKHPGG